MRPPAEREPAAGVIALLAREKACLEALLAVLEGERRAIEARRANDIEQAATEKERLMHELERLERERRLAAAEEPRPSGPQSSRSNSSSGDGEADVRRLLLAAREANRANGRLIEASQRFARRAVEVLLRSEGDLYGPLGELRSGTRSLYSSSA